MATGEGKTLVAILPAFLNALSGLAEGLGIRVSCRGLVGSMGIDYIGSLFP